MELQEYQQTAPAQIKGQPQALGPWLVKNEQDIKAMRGEAAFDVPLKHGGVHRFLQASEA